MDSATNRGATPLFIASQNGHLEVVRELLARGAAPGMMAANGATVLSRAAAKGHGDVALLLRAACERGACKVFWVYI